MNIRQIEIFHALMTTGTATKAAEVLRVSQPAVSKTIQELERDLGFKLFHRSKGRMTPTSEGGLFFREVEASFAGLAHLRNAAARIRDFGSGQIRLASLSALSTTVVPAALAHFRTTNPNVAITFQTHSSSMVRDLIATGQFDIGLAADEIDATGVLTRPFASYQAVVAVPSSHRLASASSICVEDMNGEPFIALAAEDTSRREAEALFEAAGIRPKIVVETPYSTTICSMVQAGLGIGIVHPLTTAPYEGSGLVVVPFAGNVSFRALLLLPPHRPTSRILEGLVENLIAASRR